VLLSTAAMCMAMTWMLQGVDAAGMGAAGRRAGLNEVRTFQLLDEQLLGGAVAAIGGALVLERCREF